MKDPTPRFGPLIDSIWMIAPENYKSHTDALAVSQNLLFVLYEHAAAYAYGKTGTEFESIYDVPQEIQDEYFSQVEIAAHIFTTKALAALHAADPALAYRILEDAEKILPEPKAYIEPFFYSLMMGLILGESEEYLANAAKRIREETPYIESRIEFLLSRVDSVWWEPIEDKLKKLLSQA